MSLTSLLPAPSNSGWEKEPERKQSRAIDLIQAKATAPPYGQRYLIVIFILNSKIFLNNSLNFP